MKTNNNGTKRLREAPTELIDILSTSTEKLYQISEQQYTRLSSFQKSKWLSIIRKGGTKKDKLNLMATEILSNPHTCLQQFEELVHECFDKNHHHSIQACQILTNLFHEFVFNDKESLRTFSEALKEAGKSSKKKVQLSLAELVSFYLQHHIKHFYAELVRSIEVLLGSSVTFVKKTAITMLTSLTKHQELRRMIIGIMINKFGDTDMDVVNHTYKSLKLQFYQDIQSSTILLEQAEAFLFRSKLPRKAQFYVVDFLNNLKMNILNEEALSKLFELFYHFFEKLMGQDNEEGSVSSRLFLNSIKGLNKIFSFVKGRTGRMKELIGGKVQSVYKIIHQTVNIKAKVQLYLFLFQYHSYIHGSIPDRFYRSLYDFLNQDDILHCSLAELFFDLLLISIKQDESTPRILAFIKRILQLCFTAEPNFIATTLIMIGRIVKEKEGLEILIHQKENSMSQQNEEGNHYNPEKRQPRYAGAENTLLWQLTVLSSHFHPTVRKFAQSLLKKEEIVFDGKNPLIELSTTSFLEKLVLKKERKSEGWKLKMKKHVKKMRTSKYDTLVDKNQDEFKEDEDFIKKYLQQRLAIHNNFKKKQPTDIEEFADEVIEKEMERLNPRDEEAEFSLSDEPVSDDQLQDEGQDDGQDQIGEQNNMNDEQEEGADENSQDLQFQSEENMDESQQDDESQDIHEDQKEWEEAFDEIGKNDEDDYPKNKPIKKKNNKTPPRKNLPAKRKHYK